MLARQESDIVIAAQSGNRNAFEQLVMRYQNLITSLAFSKTGDLQRSEDIAQQAFLTAWEKRAELRDPTRFGGWLRSITRNITLNSNRHSKRLDRSAQSLTSCDEPVRNDRPEESLATTEQQELLWASLKNIPDEYREPLVLFYREHKSVAQVADLMDLSVDAVKQRLSRGRGMLKNEVEQFVEDLLGASKPSASFASGVMVALPAVASSTAGKFAIQSGTAVGAKSMFGDLGFLASGPVLGTIGGIFGGAVGVAGAWYGTKAAEKHATSEQEKKLLWWFFNTVTVVTLLLTSIAVIGVLLSPEGPIRLTFVIVFTAIYTTGLVGLTICFLRKQSELHSEHGKPKYPTELVGNKPASPAAFRFAIISATVGCWAWLIILAFLKLDWIVVSVSIPVILGILAWRLTGLSAQTTVPSQMKYQATGVFSNMLVSGLIAICAWFLGTNLNYDPVPIWTVGLLVIMVGWLVAGAIWYGANKIEEDVATDT